MCAAPGPPRQHSWKCCCFQQQPTQRVPPPPAAGLKGDPPVCSLLLYQLCGSGTWSWHSRALRDSSSSSSQEDLELTRLVKNEPEDFSVCMEWPENLTDVVDRL
ncbi:hypothetical protein ACOMHN_034305 [Nucella lapillus]